MNNQRRKKLKEGIAKINEAREIIEDIMNDEEMAFDSLSEGLQQTMRGEKMGENVDTLSDTIDKIDEILQDLELVD